MKLTVCEACFVSKRNWIHRTLFLLLAALLLTHAPGTARAEDNTSTVISNQVVDHGGLGGGWYYYIGQTGTNNTLLITSGGVFSNILISIIGDAATANNNAVTVTGSNSVWYSNNAIYPQGGALYVGSSGSFNTLTITNGGTVINGQGTIIGLNSGANNNAVIVTGSNSVWSGGINTYIEIGHDGSFNTMTINNGARVYDYEASIGTDSSNANNNAVLVTGSGSVWSNTASLVIGGAGSGNTLTITNGGVVYSSFESFIGQNTGANSNVVTVTGTNSVWNTGGGTGNPNIGLYIGNGGSSNILTIANGGTVFSTNSYIGNQSHAVNNAVTVTGHSSVWNDSGDLYVGSVGSFNTLTITNGGTVYNAEGYIGAATGANSNVVIVTGSGSVWSNRYNLSVGESGSGNTLTIANSGTVYSAVSFIGGNHGNNNAATVTGHGSVWNSSDDFYVGAYSSGCALTITNGGAVFSYNGYVGYDNSNNVAIVTGASSVWSNTQVLYIGDESAWAYGNKLIITNGGAVFSNGGYIGGYGGNNNAVVVTDTNSVWNNSSYLYVGCGSAFNTLTITNGGTVYSANAYIGYDYNTFLNPSGNTSNAVTVTGAGSVWNNNGELVVGLIGTNNSLNVFSGGKVNTGNLTVNNGKLLLDTVSTVNISGGSNGSGSNSLYVGQSASGYMLTITNGGFVNSTSAYIGFGGSASSNNAAIVTGPGSVWTNSGALVVGSAGTNNSLSVIKGGKVNTGNLTVNNGTLLIDRPSTVSVSGNYTQTVAGTLSLLIGTNYFTPYLYVTGAASITGTLQIASFNGYTPTGGTTQELVQATTSFSGSGFTLVNNISTTLAPQLIYLGQYLDLVWSSSSSPTVGDAYWTNSVSDWATAGNWTNNGPFAAVSAYVANGGTATVQSSGQTCTNLYIFNGGVIVTNGGVLNVGANIVVGSASHAGSLLITSGGVLANGGSGYIGSNANNSAVLVTGTGSVWSNSGNLYIGYSGSGNTLTIANSGTVYNTTGYIGNNAGANNNAVTVTGSGSVWTNNGDLYVGYSGSINSLIISNGGNVYNAMGWIGYGPGANNNTVIVTGSNSVWNISEYLNVGVSGSCNSVTISNGGIIASWNGDIGGYGSYTGANSNSVTVTGTGSVWTNKGILLIGDTGSFNTLTITNGGVVFNNQGYVGSSGNSNAVTVTGPNSVWSNSWYLCVGRAGSFNTLTIANGGKVYSSGLPSDIGYAPGANNNALLVTGAGSVWNINNDLYIGCSSSGNTMTIADSGTVFNANAYIGGSNGANNNAVTVTGSGSVWSNSGTGSNPAFSVGYNGSGNSLTIANGGSVIVTNAGTEIGSNAGANSNSVTVTGAGSKWQNQFYIDIGSSGSFNSLTISSNGVVSGASGYIGYNTGANSNSVTVTGSGSVWSNTMEEGIFVGYQGSGNSMIVSNGGKVFSNSGTIGLNTGANNNSVLVTGSGSVWSNNTDLVVGKNGSGNSLTIANSGTVYNVNSTIGFIWIASNNTVTVTGTSSVWNNSGALVVGMNGGNNRLSVISGGTVNAGNMTVNNGTLHIDPLSTVNVSGNYTQTVAGTLELAIGPSVLSQYLNVTGTASLTGTLRLVQFNSYLPSVGSTQQLVEAGTLSGTFTLVNQIPTFLTPSLLYLDATDVDLIWSAPLRVLLLPYALTPNQRAVAANIDGASTDPRLADLENYFLTIPTNQIPANLDLISPDELSVMAELTLAGMNARGYSFLSRVNELRAESHGFNANRFTAYNSGPGQSFSAVRQKDSVLQEPSNDMFSSTKDNPWGIYLEGAGEFLDISGDYNASGYHPSSGGLTIGIDRRIGEQFAVGFTLGYTYASAGLVNDGHVDMDNGRASLYAAWFKQGFHLEGMVSGGINSYDTRRGTIGGMATGSTDGSEFSGLIGGGYDWTKGIWTFGPQVSLQLKHVDIDGFTESGSSVPLQIQSQSDNSLESRLGAHVGCRVNVGKVLIAPELSLSWQHQHLDNCRWINSRFANGAGNIFSVYGPVLGRDSAVIGAGVWVQWTPLIGTYLNYTAETGGAGYSAQIVSAGVSVRF